MRQITDRLELAKIQKEERGFVLNVRPDAKRLHKAGCEAVGAMATTEHRKYFAEEDTGLVTRLNEQFGEHGWRNCGRSGGLNLPISIETH
jgi:hypothetical protein